MSFLLRPLGLIAFVSDRLSRSSLKGVPMNWAAVAFLLLIFGASTESWKDAHLNGKRPQVLSIGQFTSLADARYAHWYVDVAGVVLPRDRFSVVDSVTKNGKYDLVAFLDKGGREGIWLKTAPGEYAGQKPFPARVVGLMGRPSDDFDTHFVGRVPQIGGAIMQQHVWLEAGNTPSSAFWAGFTFVTCGVGTLLLVGASLARNTVFWPDSGARATLPSAPPAKVAPNASIPLRVTGRLRAGPKKAGRFLNVPAQTVATKDGALAVTALVDPTREPGSRVQPVRAGDWLLLPTGPFQTRNGVLACGTKLYPAFKIQYFDALDKGRRVSAIFACDDETTRAALLARLHQEAARGASNSSSASPFEAI